jgi:hypothetical protein
MLARLRLKTKVQLLPGLTGIAFLALIAINISHGRDNTAQLAQIESGHFPALEASRELVVLLEETRRLFQDATSAQDASGVDAVRVVHARFDASLEVLAKSSVVAGKTVTDLRASYARYVDQATAVARRLIGEVAAQPAPAPEPAPAAKGTRGADAKAAAAAPAPAPEPEADEHDTSLTVALEQLTADYNSLQTSVKALNDAQRTHMTSAFIAARQTSADATRANVVIGVVCLVALLLLTYWTLRSVLATLAEASGFVSAAAAEILAVAQQTEANAADEAALRMVRCVLFGRANP